MDKLALCNSLVNRVLKLINLNRLFRAHVAQSVERFLGKEEVHRFDSGHGLQNRAGKNKLMRGKSKRSKEDG